MDAEMSVSGGRHAQAAMLDKPHLTIKTGGSAGLQTVAMRALIREDSFVRIARPRREQEIRRRGGFHEEAYFPPDISPV